LTRAQRRGRAVALGLTGLRAALAPVLVALGIAHGGGLAAAALIAGFVSDVFDGVVARRFGVSTAGLRRLDSITDIAFYLAAVFCAWRLQPQVLRAYAIAIALVVGTLVFDHLVERWKFGRAASYHAWTAKLWGLTLFAALVLLFARGSGALLPLAIACGLLSNLEDLAITLVLPAWRHDVPSVVHAWRIRAESSRRPAA
jgi:phosphatidylglycerophosphate synthase